MRCIIYIILYFFTDFRYFGRENSILMVQYRCIFFYIDYSFISQFFVDVKDSEGRILQKKQLGFLEMQLTSMQHHMNFNNFKNSIGLGST